MYAILNQNRDYRVFIFKDFSEARGALEVFKYKKAIDESFFNAYLLNEFSAHRGEDLRSYSFELGELIANLCKFYSDKNGVLLCPLRSIIHPLPAQKHLQTIKLKNKDQKNFNAFKKQLFNYGYEILDLVCAKKEMAIKGDIIDIFPLNYDNPIRISFFDDEVESMRFFDIENQMCFGENLDEICIFPALFSLNEMEFEYLAKKCESSPYSAFSKDIYSLGFWLLDSSLISQQFKAIMSPSALESIRELSELEILKGVDFKHFFGLECIKFRESYEDLNIDSNQIKQLISLHKNKAASIICQNDLLLDSLEIDGEVRIIKENIALNIITPSEIILSSNKIAKAKKKPPKAISLNELNINDYIVHNDYGIGVFKGIIQAEILGVRSEFLEILYQNDDKLLLPTYNLNLISKYIASTSSVPTIDSLGKGNFAKLKQKIRPKLLQIAQEIIDLSAKRELMRGIKINCNLPEILIFKEKSNFILTSDQEKSIEEIFGDLASGRVMDRLLIGDVGFGKTEVAMNAMFASTQNGLQCALIVPTTLLSNQHFNTLKARFGEFGISVGRLDRFAKNKKKILQDLESGALQIVVGTHSLLNVGFKNLGLIVLDEEHKFGVKQKEKLKQLSQNVHILSMSATPIPRTLNMALSKIKTQSFLNIPPEERIAPKTFVKNYDDLILKDAILRELRRNGQIFYIHNNIANIINRKNEINALLPKLKIAILHSKIAENESENIMLDFANGAFDMLLSTSIIESGIHLPNANTIIVDGADCFGMADLHQLRGRIGRGNKEGYCYFFVDNKESITQEAKKRLLSLESNSFLGSGAVLSYNDLEIRGGGNILGQEQSGHIKHIGYSLYLQMLEDSINILSGKNSLQKKGVDLKLNISAFLNAEFISSSRIRLDFYRRLSMVENKNELFDIEREICDRFGRLDSYSKRFLQLMLIKLQCNLANIERISNYHQNISIKFYDGKSIQIAADEKDDDSVIYAILGYLNNFLKQVKLA